MSLIDELYALIEEWREAGQYEPQWDIAADELEDILEAYLVATE